MRDRTLPPTETIEIADVARTLTRQWRAILSFLALGIVGALAVALFAPRRFDGKATLLARAGATPGGSILGRMTGVGELLGSVGGAGMGASQVETELQVLRSRTLAGRVVDSLRLQFSVRSGRRIPPAAIVSDYALAPAFSTRTYSFTREASGAYRVRGGNGGGGGTYEATPGTPSRLDIGTLTLATTNLPPSFTLRVLDRETAIDRFASHLEATKAGGDVVKVVYRGEDSVTAASAANALIAFYLERRLTTDRGVNQRRVEYITQQLDRTGSELSAAERGLRQYQEASGVLDADVMGKAELEGSADLRRDFTEIQVDEAGIKQLLAQAASGRITSRDLAAYPAFLKGSAVSPLVTQLSDLEATRIRLLERRTERDPEVVAIDHSMQAIAANIVAIAKTYAEAVTRQRVEFQTRLDSLHRILLGLPVAAERGGRLRRDVMRLTSIYTALEAQLVEARLAAIGEGGDVRQIDVAVPQREPAFPQPLLTMGLGTAGGLVAGIIAALCLGWFGRTLRDPAEIERVTGVAALRLDPTSPLLVSGVAAARTLLVVPLDDRARAADVAASIAQAGSVRSLRTTVLDLSDHPDGGNGNGASVNVGGLIDQLEQTHEMVVVQLPSLTSSATIGALRENRPVVLVTGGGPVERTRLGGALDTLRRLQVPCAGVVVTDAPPALAARARTLT
jgi:uncharacterized protein involved in exopolysaccharide biosynthesis